MARTEIRIPPAKFRTLHILSFLLIAFLILSSFGISQVLYNPNDERFKSLYLEKVESDYSFQKQEFSRQKSLFEKNLISTREFNESEARFKTAKITYQQAILSLAFEQPHITIEEAVKYQTRDGRKRVKLTLRNTTGGNLVGSQIDSAEIEDYKTDRISNVYISLLNDQNGFIGQPYEFKISTMYYNKPVSVDFSLLQDLDYVTVKTVYGEKSDEKKIFLSKDAATNRVIITTRQFSQETDLGASAIYTLSFESYSPATNVYKLYVANLPRQITYDFMDTQTNTRVSQIQFTVENSAHSISLVVYLPELYDSSFVLDKPIHFYALAVPQSFSSGAIDLDKTYNIEALEKLNLSFVQLELIPKGTGRLEIQANNYYNEASPGEQIRIRFSIKNDGTQNLDDVTTQTSVPADWTIHADNLVGVLPPGEMREVSLLVETPRNIGAGEYECTVKALALSNNHKLESESKRFHIRINSGTSAFMKIGLLGIIGAALLSLVVFVIRRSRR